jgi:tetratricopeptide (TPR) repeat protein
VIVGRERELEDVGQLVAGWDAGPAVLVVEGEAGIGKTTIWEGGLAAAEPARVLVARAAQGEMPLSFAAVADLLGGELDELLPALAAPRREALEVALLLASPRGAAPDARAVAAAFLDALRLLAPVLVAVDDVQWLDPPSATALAFAMRRLRDEPVRFLLTRRVPSPPPLGLDRAPPWLPVQRLEVGPLSLAALQRLLRVRRGDALNRPALRRVHTVSGGNPLFALELAGALEGRWAELAPGRPLPVPDELGALLSERLAGLPAGTREALLTAALLAEPTAERVGADALAPAAQAGVVALAGRRVRFTHPLLAVAIVESASPAEQRAMHRRLAETAPGPETRARHLALAAEGPDEAVAAELDAAAATVAARGAPEAAAELAEHALALTPPDRDGSRRALACARYEWAAGDVARARSRLEDAAAGPLRAQALVDLARLDMHAGDRRRAAALYREAQDAANGDRALLAQIHEGLAWCLFLTREDVPAAARHAREAVALADDPVLLGDALSVQAQTEFFLGGGLPSPAMERALKIHPADTADVRVLRQPRMHWAVVLQNADRLDEARELLEHVRASAAEHGRRQRRPVGPDAPRPGRAAGRALGRRRRAARGGARARGRDRPAAAGDDDAVRPRAAVRAAGARRGGARRGRRGSRCGRAAGRRHRRELRPVGARDARALARERPGRSRPPRRAPAPDRRLGDRRPGRAALARRPDRGAGRARAHG